MQVEVSIKKHAVVHLKNFCDCVETGQEKYIFQNSIRNLYL